MIETRHTILINRSVERVWDYARDMGKWASIFPGCREFKSIDDDNSEWTIKVGVGGLVRVVGVHVRVDSWRGPERVDFSYRLKTEPVVGQGSYSAVATGVDETELTLHVEIQGNGQMAVMWESMCRPVIPMLLKSFAQDFKAEVEKTAETTSPVASVQMSWFERVRVWLRSLWTSADHGRSPR